MVYYNTIVFSEGRPKSDLYRHTLVYPEYMYIVDKHEEKAVNHSFDKRESFRPNIKR
jgi:hypothetical protein